MCSFHGGIIALDGHWIDMDSEIDSGLIEVSAGMDWPGLRARFRSEMARVGGANSLGIGAACHSRRLSIVPLAIALIDALAPFSPNSIETALGRDSSM